MSVPGFVHRETVLSMRAQGATVGVIGRVLRLDPDVVSTMIAFAGGDGDGRALSDKLAAERRRALGDAARSTAIRAGVVGRFRALAVLWRGRSAKAAAGCEHLADLYEHCDRKYPEHSIPSEDDARSVLTASSAVARGSALADL